MHDSKNVRKKWKINIKRIILEFDNIMEFRSYIIIKGHPSFNHSNSSSSNSLKINAKTKIIFDTQKQTQRRSTFHFGTPS